MQEPSESPKPKIKLKLKPPKKAPSLFKVIKCPLKKVLKHYDLIQPIIEQYVRDINQIVMLGYQFIKCYLFDRYDHGLELPIIDPQWVLIVLKTIAVKGNNRGTCNAETLKIKDDFQVFYDNVFSKVMKIEQPTYYHQNLVLEEQSKQMFTCLKTNLKTNFIKYLFKYVNIVHKNPRVKEIKQEPDKVKRKQLYSQLTTEIGHLKTDLINKKIEESDPQYHAWIKTEMKYLFPDGFVTDVETVAYDVKCRPMEYLNHAIYINRKIEELGARPYQIFPQRNSYKPHFIPLESSSIVEMLADTEGIWHIPMPLEPPKKVAKLPKESINTSDKVVKHPRKTTKPKTVKPPKETVKKPKRVVKPGEMCTNSYLKQYAGSFHDPIWSQILHLENKDQKNDIFHQPPYSFYYQIKTDGFSCDLLFILTQYANRGYGQRVKQSEDGDQDKNQEEDEKGEFTRLEQLGPAKCKHYLTGKYRIVSQDPGEIDPVSLMDQKGNFFQYSACQRRVESYTKRSAEILYREKQKAHIDVLEARLTGDYHYRKKKKRGKHKNRYRPGVAPPSVVPEPPVVSQKIMSGRTTHMDLYHKFLDIKNELGVSVKSFYENMLFRKLAFRRYVRTQQSEVKLIKTIKHLYLPPRDIKDGYQLLILYGDHSRTTQMKGCVPCPGKGMKRLLARHFTVIEVNEYLTSRIHHKRLKRMTNLRVRQGNHYRQVHKILTLTGDPARRIYVNRDYNACCNILNLGMYYLVKQKRPTTFRHPTKQDTQITDLSATP